VFGSKVCQVTILYS